MTDLLKPGWLKEQFEEVKKDIEQWPLWMRQAAGLETDEETMKKKIIDSPDSDLIDPDSDMLDWDFFVEPPPP